MVSATKRSFAFFQSSKENFLEYDLARLVYTLANRDKPAIALYAGLPVNGGFDPATQQPTQAWAAIEQAQLSVRDSPAYPKASSASMRTSRF